MSATARSGRVACNDGDRGTEADALGHPPDLLGRDGGPVEHHDALVGLRHGRGERRDACPERGLEQLGRCGEALRDVAQRAPELGGKVGLPPAREDPFEDGAVVTTQRFHEGLDPLALRLPVERLDEAIFGALRDLRGELVEQLARGHPSPAVLLVEVGDRVLGEAVAYAAKDSGARVRRELNSPCAVETLEGAEQADPPQLVSVLASGQPEVPSGAPGPPDD